MLIFFSAASPSWSCSSPIAKVVSIEGLVQTRSENHEHWRQVKLADSLCAGDTVAVRSLSRAAIVMANDIVLRLDQNTTLNLRELKPEKPFELGLMQGVLHVLSRFGKRFSVITPYLNAMVDGTEFTVNVTDTASTVTVTEGQVSAENTQGQQRLNQGMSAQSIHAQAPTLLTINPKDSVQWALFFPQIVQPTAAEFEALPSDIKTAAQLAKQGQYSQALAAWPETETTTLREARAGWLLGVGRVSQAQALIEDQQGTPQAQAITSLIQVTENQTSAALSTAQQATRTDPQSAAAQLALSYALQAGRNISAATEAAQKATELQPDHALAWARLAELQLSSGWLMQGQASAQKALEIEPKTPRAQALLGYANLLRGQLQQAKESFTQAQTQHSADPLPHLGLGLVAWRLGQPDNSRREFEMAVMLDPGNAETRATLGMVYLRQQRFALAATEIDLAQALDPQSPTPWFTNAALKQRQNRPIEASQDLERALTLSPQRAIIRSTHLLNIDNAARTTALASTWQTLGFDGSALFGARAALMTDSQNPATHHLLASAYANHPRLERARVSELLQAQLRQSPHIEPIPTQELTPQLPIAPGPRSLALQDTSALFDETHSGARLSAMVGNHGSLGSAASAWRRLGSGQLSVGHFSYATDGLTPKFNLKINTQNLLWHSLITPELSAQAELRRARRQGGEVTQRLNPQSQEPERERRIDTDTWRLGFRYAPTPQTQWLGSLIKNQRNTQATDTSAFRNGKLKIDRTENNAGKLAELMLSHHTTEWQWNVGLSALRVNISDASSFTLLNVQAPVPPNTAIAEGAVHDVLFTQTSVRLTSKVTINAGLTLDHFSYRAVSISKAHPKLGLIWQPTPATSLRLATYTNTTGTATKEQTLEPTQFVGFNQNFDDRQAATSKQRAIGLEHQLNHSTRLGLEAIQRALILRITPIGKIAGCTTPVCPFNASENLHRIYINATLGSRWALSGALDYENQNIKTPSAPFNIPGELTTWQLKARAHYFQPKSWSAYAQIRAVEQRTHHITTPQPNSQARFVLLDAGLRLQPTNSRFAAFLDVTNVFNRQFNFQNTAIGDTARIPLFQSGRAVMGRIEMRF